jgi:two-component system cell cycle response regulator
MTVIDLLSVLAIDDNPADLALLRRALQKVKRWNIQFEGVTGVDDAERLLRHGAACDVIFMDYRLGATDGVEAIGQLRSMGCRVPIILLTGQGDEKLAAASRRQGANDYLCKDDAKPEMLEESLRFVISEYVRERRDSNAIRAATTDGLTGLMVKGYMAKRANDEIERARRHGSALSCIMFDLDHFKSINDNYGHMAGDDILRRCAEVLRRNLRSTDIAGRFGGEEFCVFLPECSLSHALRIAERVRAEIEELETPCGDEIIRATTSAGAAETAQGVETVEALIKAADQALYKAKRDGRNRVCAAGTPAVLD